MKNFNGGLVALYTTPKALHDKIEEYFDSCFIMRMDEKLGIERPYEINTPTWSGFARYLGFRSRGEMLAYAQDRNQVFSNVLQEGLLRLEEYAEKRLMTTKTNATGVLAILKNNAKWFDQTEKQLSDEEGRPLVFTWASQPVDGDVSDASLVEPKQISAKEAETNKKGGEKVAEKEKEPVKAGTKP